MKRYTAFISSTYKDLVKVRRKMIDSLLNCNIIPIGMEHFTASSSDNFRTVERLIDISDIFILILGGKYGSCDENGVSYTEREYNYAKAHNIKRYTLKTQNYRNLEKREQEGAELTEEEKKQLAFGKRTGMGNYIVANKSIDGIVSQIVTSDDIKSCIGWVRPSTEDEEEWEQRNSRYNLAGTWYHVHLKQQDKNYLRVGTVEIRQNFNPKEYRFLKLEAQNYSVASVDAEHKTLAMNYMQNTEWSGEYFLKEDRKIIGLYKTMRYFDGKFCEKEVPEGSYSGLHEFKVKRMDINNDGSIEKDYVIYGSFHDIYPDPTKSGQIFMFRTEEERFSFLVAHYKGILKGEKQ